MEEWEVPCPDCRNYQPLVWSEETGKRDERGLPIYAGILWTTDDNTKPAGRWHFDRLRPTVRWRCAVCLEKFEDTAAFRRQQADLGRFRSLNPNAPSDRRSFHWPSWASPDVSLFSIVEEFLRAKDQELVGNSIPMQEWYRKRLAVSYDASLHAHYELVPTVEIATNKEGKPLWPLQDFIFLLIDVQRDHFFGLVQAWSKLGQDMCLWFGKLLTWEDIAAKQAEFKIADQCVFVDSRHKTHLVYQQCVLHGHIEVRDGRKEWKSWIAMAGDARREFIHVPRWGEDKGRRIRTPYSWGEEGGPAHWADPCLGIDADDPLMPALRGKLCPVIYMAKGTIDGLSFERRDHMMRGETSLVAPGSWNKEFSKQMHGEHPEVTVSPMGHQSTKSKRVGPNHGLDCYRMGITAACMAKILNPFQ